MAKRAAVKRTTRAAFRRDMYLGTFGERCFTHHEGECPQWTPASAYICPCEFRSHAGLACVVGAKHPERDARTNAA